MVDALVSGASAARRAGSSPVLGTKRRRATLFAFLCVMGNFVRSFNQKANARGDVERDARALACDGVVCIS